MLVTGLAALISNNHYLFTLAQQHSKDVTNICKSSPTLSNQHHCYWAWAWKNPELIFSEQINQPRTVLNNGQRTGPSPRIKNISCCISFSLQVHPFLCNGTLTIARFQYLIKITNFTNFILVIGPCHQFVQQNPTGENWLDETVPKSMTENPKTIHKNL